MDAAGYGSSIVRSVPEVVACVADKGPNVDASCFCSDREAAEGMRRAQFGSVLRLLAVSGHTSGVRAGASRGSVDE